LIELSDAVKYRVRMSTMIVPNTPLAMLAPTARAPLAMIE
jgi:hypothetical protein